MDVVSAEEMLRVPVAVSEDHSKLWADIDDRTIDCQWACKVDAANGPSVANGEPRAGSDGPGPDSAANRKLSPYFYRIVKDQGGAAFCFPSHPLQGL